MINKQENGYYIAQNDLSPILSKKLKPHCRSTVPHNNEGKKAERIHSSVCEINDKFIAV
jgi:hypothetical protein